MPHRHFSSKVFVRMLFFENETNCSLNDLENPIKLKNPLQNSFKLCKISTFNCCFLCTLILLKLKIIAFTDTHSFGLVRPRKMKAKDTLLMNNTIQ